MRLAPTVLLPLMWMAAGPALAQGATKSDPPVWYRDADSRATVYFLSSDDVPPDAYLAVYGDDFGASGTVRLGSVDAPVVTWSDRKVVVRVPAGAGGPLVVRPTGGTDSDPFPLTIRAGRVRHLSASAAPGGDGSSTAPWNDFAAADAALTAGDFVVVHAGTYTGSGEYAWDANSSGSAGRSITWFVAPGEVAVVDGSTVTKTAIRVDGSHVNMVGLVARGSKYQNIHLNAANSRAVDCEAKEGDGAVSTKGQGINISGAGAKALGNYVHHNYSHGFYANASDIEIAYNYVSDSGCCGAPASYGYGIQLYLVDPGPTYYRPVVRRNYVTRSNRSGIVSGQYCSGARIEENTVKGNRERAVIVNYGAVDTSIRNNVFYRNDTAAAGYYEIDLDTSTNVDVFNNVVTSPNAVAKRSTATGTVRIDWNFYQDATRWSWNGGSSTTLAAWRSASGQDANSRTGDPLFAAPAADDFRPASGSPMIDGGLDAQCARTVQGAHCDQGAFETPPAGDPSGPSAPTSLRRTDVRP